MKMFVYGTLKKGGRLYTRAESSIKKDSISGSLYNLKYYPGIKLDGAGVVEGEVHELDDRYLPWFDHVEGEGSLYNRRTVRTLKGETVYVYEYACYVSEHWLIESGIWENNNAK